MLTVTIKPTTDCAATIQVRPNATSSTTNYILVYTSDIDSQMNTNQDDDLKMNLLVRSTPSDKEAFLTMLASEPLLSRAWDSLEDDEAWKDL